MNNRELTQEQINGFREAFLLFDTDNSGKISLDELEVVMNSLGHRPTDEELKYMIAEADADGDGEVDFDEFLTLMKRQMKHINPEDELVETFKVFDKNGDGKISRMELKTVMASLGESLNDEMLHEMIKEADLDGDGFINLQEFMYFMKNIEMDPECPPQYLNQT